MFLKFAKAICGAGLVAGAVFAANPSAAGPDRVGWAPVGEQTSVPYGWIDFCQRYRGECDGPRTMPRDIELTPKALKEIERINKWVNKNVESVSDMEHWGVIDQWDYPTDGKGDCEDYVLLKRKLLAEQGFPIQALLVTVVKDKNNDGRVQFYNGANKELTTTAEYAKTWNGNELTVNNDILVLALPEVANMPGWLIGLMAAGGIAAALSTASGLLLAISSAVSHDLLKNTLMPHISEKTEMLYARLAMTGAIIVATWLGLNPPGFAAQTVALAFGMAAATLFPALIMGIFVKRVNNKGAVAGMLAGAALTIGYIFMYLGWFFIPGTNTFPNTPEHWIMGISPLSVGVIGAVTNFVVAIGVSLASEEPSEEIQEMVRRVRYP